MKILQAQSSSSSSSSSSSTTTTTTVQSTTAPDYEYIILSDGSRYKLFKDGTIESMTGKVVSTTGLAGFQTYLSTFTTTTTITKQIVPDYQIAVAGGVEYYIYSNGTVTLSNGQYVTIGGIQGLVKHLTVTQTITKTVVADYQIVTANGVEYRLFTNGSIYLADGTYVTKGGVEGLKAYLTELQRASQPDYQIVTANGIDYRLYSNGSVYDNLDVFVVSGGIEGLKAYLTKT